MLQISHAAARKQTLLAAAQEILQERNDSAEALLISEQMKDPVLSQSASMTSFEDVETVGRMIKNPKIMANSKIVKDEKNGN
jgi:hypothetical protein